jgi:hypothetical protein
MYQKSGPASVRPITPAGCRLEHAGDLDGKTASADQLAAGSEVRASYRQQSGEAHAIKIEAKTSKK